MANVRLLAIGSVIGGGQMVGLLRLRFAAGVCVLAAGLLMGVGGAVAVADPGSSGSAAHGNDDTNASGKHGNGNDATDASGKHGNGNDATDASGQPSTGANSPSNEPGGTDTTDETNDSGIVAAVPDPVVAAVPDPVAAPAPDPVVAAVPDPVAAPAPDPVAPAPNAAAPAPDPVAPAPTAVAPVSDVIATQNMLTSVAGAVVPLTQPQSDLYSLPMSSDVSALIQDMLTSVAGVVVPLTQLQSDLYSFLVRIAGMDQVVAAVTLTWIQSNLGGVDYAGLSPAPDASVASMASLSRLVQLFAGIPGGPLAGNATEVAPLGGIAASIFAAMTQLGEASSLPGMKPQAPNDATPMGVEPFFGHAHSGLLPALSGASGLTVLTAAGVLQVSLAALAALALPGVGGLTILTAAGVRIGYRQAKAGFVIRTAGIAHFAPAGAVSLSVVRSGSLVVARPPLRVIRPEALSAGCLLDKVA